MIADRLLWWLLPGFVLVSGNFSPFRIGPILPIFGLLIIYVLGQHGQLSKFFQKNSLTVLALVVITAGAILMALYTAIDYGLQGNEFEGALQPIPYSLMSLCRYLLVVLVLIILTREDALHYRKWWLALLVSYYVILLPLYAQALLHVFFNYDFGYLFPVETAMRYGGLIGEPQTISAWLCSLFMVLFLGVRDRATRFVQFLLIASLLLALVLTQSTAWIIAFLSFWLIRARLWQIAIILLVMVITGVADRVTEKIIADIFTVSERSITILAGVELFIKNPMTMLFGYGVGLTPYLITNTDVFASYASFNLSDMGRQTVMNTYLEVIFEFGLVGGLVYFYLLIKACRITSIREVLNVLPILIGIFGVSGGFSSGYFLISVPFILRLSKNQKATV